MPGNRVSSQAGELKDRIRLVRRMRSWSVQEMANHLGTKAYHVYKWELGEQAPRSHALAALARLAEVTKSDLQTGGVTWHQRVERWLEQVRPQAIVDASIAEATSQETKHPLTPVQAKSPLKRVTRPILPPQPRPIPPCKTERVCPHAPGWCMICFKTITPIEHVFMRMARQKALTDASND